jgi:hypothetical protein
MEDLNDDPRPLLTRFVTPRALRLAALAFAALAWQSLGVAADLQRLQTWGLETNGEINGTLRVPGTRLYAETASLSGVQSGGFNGRAFVWPASTQFRVLNTLAQIDPATYASNLNLFATELHNAYWNNGYRSGAGGGDRFYDDNAHLVVAFVEAHRLTNDSTYLIRARDAFSFVLQGEDAVAGGGIYFKQNDFASKDAISTLQAARGAAMLYRATREQTYLSAATRLLNWANTHIQRPDGLYSERWRISTNAPEGFDLINSAGIGISTNLELYGATGNSAYLSEAQRIANRSLSRYFDSATGRINDEGFWAFELVDAFDNLHLHDKNPLWIDRADRALVWLHDNKRDPNGRYGLFWGRNGPQVGTLASWHLNDQAPVARAYLYTSAVSQPVPSAWNVDAGGNWSSITNWTLGNPNIAGATAVFGNKITAPRTVTVNSPVTLGRIDFNSAHAYTVAGDGALTLNATRGDAQINVIIGSHTISAPLSLADNTLITVSPAASSLSITSALIAADKTVNKHGDGTLTLGGINAAGLSIIDGTVVLAPGSGVSVLNSLSIGGGVQPIPEPSASVLIATGALLAGLGARSWRRRKP